MNIKFISRSLKTSDGYRMEGSAVNIVQQPLVPLCCQENHCLGVGVRRPPVKRILQGAIHHPISPYIYIYIFFNFLFLNFPFFSFCFL